MLKIIEQTYEDKYNMYSVLSKDQLIRMVIECNRIIDSMKSYREPYVVLNQEDTDER